MTSATKLLFCALGLTVPAVALARRQALGKHRVLLEATSAEPRQWNSALDNVENVRKALRPGRTTVVVVVHGGSLDMLRMRDNSLTSRLQQLADGNVVFEACENTMRRRGITKGELLPFVVTVDSGVAEVVRKQEQGWAYIKAGQ